MFVHFRQHKNASIKIALFAHTIQKGVSYENQKEKKIQPTIVSQQPNDTRQFALNI